MNDIAIPTLCHQQNETPVGVCRLCVVDVGARVFTASCVRPAENGMVVNTSSEKVQRARRTLVEMLMADHPSPCARQQHSGDCELETLARPEKITQPRFSKRYDRPLQRRFLDEHRRRFRRLHPVRPLHPRLQRDSRQLRPRPHGQRLARRNRFRRQRADGRILLRFLRRVHGLLPHRRAHQQRRHAHRARRWPGLRIRLARRVAARFPFSKVSPELF